MQKGYLLKNPFFMFLATCNFVVSHLKIDPAIHLKVHFCRFENLPTCLCSYKNTPENLALLILGILELFTHKVCKMFVYKHTETIGYVKK